MGEVVALRRPEPHDPHATGGAFCLQCNHEWVAVAPTGETQLQCPACKTHKGLFKFPCAPQHEMLWTCRCGNQLFNMTPEGHFCPNCGTYQEYPET